jgi:tetratricopeptide (TPR) repeat protein
MKTFALILSCSALALADEVTLKGGGKFSGIVEERGDKVTIRMEHGSFTFDREKVEKIDRTKGSVLQEYEDRLRNTNLAKVDDVENLLKWVEQGRMVEPAKELRERLGRLKWDAIDLTNAGQLEAYAAWAQGHGQPAMAQAALRAALKLRREKVDSKDADALYELGLWAKSNGLAADALVLFQLTITARPDHEFARRALGFQYHSGKWMTPNEVKVAMGLIEFEGDWMTPQAKEAILTARTLEKERRLLEEARKNLEQDRALARAEFERQRAALDLRAAEIAARLADLERTRQLNASTPGYSCGMPGCGIVVVHVHCARPGCPTLTPHTHPTNK